MRKIDILYYENAGLDLLPILHFPKNTNYIMTSILPRIEFRHYYTNESTYSYNIRFIKQLIDKMYDHDFVVAGNIRKTKSASSYLPKKEQLSLRKSLYYLLHTGKHRPPESIQYINPAFIKFHRISPTGTVLQTIHYYISTNVTHDFPNALAKDVEQCNGLIIRYESPSMLLLSHIIHPLSIYLYRGANISMFIDDKMTDTNVKKYHHFFSILLNYQKITKSVFDKLVHRLFLVGTETGEMEQIIYPDPFYKK